MKKKKQRRLTSICCFLFFKIDNVFDPTADVENKEVYIYNVLDCQI